ncbi:hypothetical protein EJ357_03575 [Streptomyces cyaneochromogenes]|uniref:Uncharacterized protein n=1 Tax=Streptomyces cyaneochromogenes TaxID=2496836 RepID=A0A3Q9EL64_9ACTN|nr:hypothetical protein [Streptomyces cyaneochromogenes]AZQ32636.1 hypothetical protein EJ357_03575 [Streptomyces cyaneochromogenes]
MDEQRAEIVAHGREALADIRRASDEAAAAIVRVVEQRTGVSLVAGPPSVMDASRAQLADADRRAQHAVAAMDIVLRRWSWGDAQTLGELMPSLPQDVREAVADHLVQAGLS